jgi:hypothetical protein
MSDDTPTQRFDAAGDTPTERFSTTAPSEEVVEERKSRKLITILAIIGGLLLVAVLIVLILLLTRGTGTPTAAATPTNSASASPTPTATPTTSATPTATPTPTPTATAAPPPPPPSNDVQITGFAASTTSQCSSQTGNPVYMHISWSSDNGIAAYFGVNTNDAQSGGMGWTLPPSGNENDFPNGYVPYEFQCGNASQKYTITIVGTNGSKQSKTVKVVNTGDVY